MVDLQSGFLLKPIADEYISHQVIWRFEIFELNSSQNAQKSRAIQEKSKSEANALKTFSKEQRYTVHSVVARHFMNFMDFIHFLAFSQLAIRRFRFIHKIARIKSRFNGYYPRHVHWILFPGYYSVNTIHRIQHLENLVNKVVGQRRRAFTAVSN